MYYGYINKNANPEDGNITIIDFPLLETHAINRTEFDGNILMCELNSDETAAMKDFTGYLFQDEWGRRSVDLYDKSGELIAHNASPLINHEEQKMLGIMYARYLNEETA